MIAYIRMLLAAPEMLEALENLENDDGKAMPPSAWKLVQDAIGKAGGKIHFQTEEGEDRL